MCAFTINYTYGNEHYNIPLVTESDGKLVTKFWARREREEKRGRGEWRNGGNRVRKKTPVLTPTSARARL